MRMTYPTAIVLHAVAQGVRHGFDIIDVSGLRAGTVYPILRRLEAERLVSSAWEPAERAHAQGRPPRRNYRVTAAGRKAVSEALARYPGVARVLDIDRGEADHASA